MQQRARDEAAVARARLRAEATSEETRLVTVTQAGARVARVQARTAGKLSEAWEELAEAHKGDGTGNALTCVTTPVTAGVTAGVTPRWDLPVWGPVAPALPPAGTARGAEETALTDDELDTLVREIRDSETPPLSYREMALRFRAQHSASETRLRAAWRRVNGASSTAG